MQRTENRSTSCRFVQIRQSTQSSKNESNSSYSCKFVRNASEDCIYPEKVPLGDDVRRSGVRVSWDVIIRMSLCLWIKRYLKGSKQSQCQCCSKVFRIEVRIEIDLICVCSDSQRISRSILVLCCKMNQTSCCQQKRKLVMEAIETILSGVISFLFFFLSPRRSDYIIRKQILFIVKVDSL
jgi:hypothetical protein